MLHSRIYKGLSSCSLLFLLWCPMLWALFHPMHSELYSQICVLCSVPYFTAGLSPDLPVFQEEWDTAWQSLTETPLLHHFLSRHDLSIRAVNTLELSTLVGNGCHHLATLVHFLLVVSIQTSRCLLSSFLHLLVWEIGEANLQPLKLFMAMAVFVYLGVAGFCRRLANVKRELKLSQLLPPPHTCWIWSCSMAYNTLHIALHCTSTLHCIYLHCTAQPISSAQGQCTAAQCSRGETMHCLAPSAPVRLDWTLGTLTMEA